jgi:hypothetical protein
MESTINSGLYESLSSIWNDAAQKVSEQFGKMKQSLVAAAGSLKASVVAAWKAVALSFERRQRDSEMSKEADRHVAAQQAIISLIEAGVPIEAGQYILATKGKAEEVDTHKSKRKATRRGKRAGKSKRAN